MNSAIAGGGGGLSQTSADARYLKQDGSSTGATGAAQTLNLGATLGVSGATTGSVKFLDGTAASTKFQVLRFSGFPSGNKIVNLDSSGLSASRTYTLPNTDATLATTANKLSAFAATTSAELAGIISDETGGGSLVFANSPTLNAPTIADFTNANHNHFDADSGGQIPIVAISDHMVARTSAQFDKTANTTLANVTGLAVSLVSGTTYRIRAGLHLTIDAVGAGKVAISGTASASAIIADIICTDITGVTTSNSGRVTALNSAVITGAGGPAIFVAISGTITAGSSGTLAIQFAQSTALGTSSVLVGSTLEVEAVA